MAKLMEQSLFKKNGKADGRDGLLCLFFTYYTSTSDLQPSTTIANQLPDQLFSTKIRTT